MITTPIIKYLELGIKYGLSTPSGNFYHHREDGPAEIIILETEVTMSWLLYNQRYQNTVDFFTDVGASDEEITYWLLKFGSILPKHATLVNDSFLGVYNLNEYRENNIIDKIYRRRT